MKKRALTLRIFFRPMKWMPVVVLIACATQIHGQTGNTRQNPIVIDPVGGNFYYGDMQNTTNFTNNYSGRPSNDVFYKLTLDVPMHIAVSHCGSDLSDTYVHLLDASGNRIMYNDNYSGERACLNIYHSFIQTMLLPGTYYIVSEGYSQNGNILTSIEGKAIFITYHYDDAGNRIARELEVSMLRSSQKENKEEITTKIEKPDNTNYETKMTVTPNPTQGWVTVEIPDDVDLSEVIIRIFDEKGTAVYNRNPLSTQTDIDLSAYPAGIYFFRVHINENVTVKKIIKK